MCRCVLVVDATEVDREAVVGDECHIVSGSPSGPRHDADCPQEELDLPDNLILLCKVHHKLIDDQPETFTAPIVRELKTNHELWVSASLSEEERAAKPIRIVPLEPASSHLPRVLSGTALVGILDGAHGSEFSHDELRTPNEADVVAAFLQEAQDYADLSGDLDAGDRVTFAFRLGESLNELEEGGFWLFGMRSKHQLQGGLLDAPSAFPVAVLRVVRADNADILTVPLGMDEQSSAGDA